MVPPAKIHPVVRGCLYLGIASVLMAAVAPLVVRRGCDLSPTTSCRAWILQLVNACVIYEMDHRALPPEDPDGGTRGLVGLLAAPSSEKAGVPPYMVIHSEDLDGGSPPQLVDPWGGRLAYRIVKGRPEFRSAGEDGRFDTEDDVTSTP